MSRADLHRSTDQCVAVRCRATAGGDQGTCNQEGSEGCSCGATGARLLPFLRDLQVLRQWTGVCDMSADGKLLFEDTDHLNLNGPRYVMGRMVADNPALAADLIWRLVWFLPQLLVGMVTMGIYLLGKRRAAALQEGT